ncbi:MAG: hypothetical protein GY940_28025 [bacterium]|nr:hypothetical protein [bacterium]
MVVNKINATITPEQEEQILQHVRDVRGILAFLIYLTSQERIRMAKLSRGRVDFVDTSLVNAKSKPEFLPAYTPLEEFINDVELKNSLYRIRAEFNSFTESLDDTILQVESETYRTSRLFYKSVKAAAKEGAEDAERIVKELAYHHKKKSPAKTAPTTDDQDTATQEEEDKKQENQE